MNLRTLLLVLLLGTSISAFSQDEIDVTKLLADTKTFIFDNNKNTVKGFIYSELEKRTTCCGSDRIYLEVKIDPSGYVLQAKTLTGKNDCFKQSAADIVKNVKWNAQDFKGPKSIYFEIKPNIDCDNGRENTYTQVPITNNKLLDENGNRIPGTGFTPPPTVAENVANTTAPATNTTTPENTNQENGNLADTNTGSDTGNKTSTPVASNQTPEQVDPPAKEVQQPATTPKESVVTNNTVTPEKTTTTPIAEAETAPQPETNTPQVVPQNTTSADELQRAKTMAEAYKAVQDSEIAALKEQMAQKKAEREAELKKEEEKQAKIAARNKRREELMERRRQAREAKETEQLAQNDDGFELFPDEEGEGSDQEKTEEDRLAEELQRLQEERTQITENRRSSEDQRREAEREKERQGQDLIRIEEEIAKIREDQERLREQKELDRLAEEERRIEDEKREREGELQRLMDEIERLRTEADQRLADLERQEEDLKRLGQEKTQREQEIEAERIKREQEQIAALQLLNLQIQAGAAGDESVTGSPDMASAIAQAMGATDSSDKYLGLIRTIAQLEAEIKRLQIEMSNLRNGEDGSLATNTTTAPSTPSTPYKSGVVLSENSGTRASENKEWENIDYKDPNADEKIYRSAPKPEPPKTNTTRDGSINENGNKNNEGGQAETTNKVPEYEKGRGFSPAESHKTTHANVAGPAFSDLQYGEGRDAMKKYITDKLKTGGVCGLAQTFAEVTVNPNGDVVEYKVLKANSELVEALLPPILQSLKFNKTNLRFNQNSYIEFKADIHCTEEEKLDLKKIKPYVEKEVTSGN